MDNLVITRRSWGCFLTPFTRPWYQLTSTWRQSETITHLSCESNFQRCCIQFPKAWHHTLAFHNLHDKILHDFRRNWEHHSMALLQWYKRHSQYITGSRRRHRATLPTTPQQIMILIYILTLVLNSWSGSSTTYLKLMQKSTNSPTCRPNTKPSRRHRKRMRKKTQQGQLGPRAARTKAAKQFRILPHASST
jgi:hypothetical protein